jgi:hypothetical protein
MLNSLEDKTSQFHLRWHYALEISEAVLFLSIPGPFSAKSNRPCSTRILYDENPELDPDQQLRGSIGSLDLPLAS